MALLFMDGFDYYNTIGSEGLRGAGWDAGIDGTPSALNLGIYAYGRHCSNITGSRTFATASTVILGFHFYPTVLLGDNSVNWITLTDNVAAATQLTLRIDSLGKILVYRGNAATLLGTATIGLLGDFWSWVSIKIKFSQTVGTVDIVVNGVSVLSLTGLDTCATANESVQKVTFGRPGNGSAYQPNWDNMHICDDTGGAPFNTTLAERRIYFFLPTGAGTASVWTANGAATFYQATNENPPTTDTTYGSSVTPGNRSDVVTADISGFTVVDAVKLNVIARKDDAGTRTMSSTVRQAGVYYDSTAVVLLSTYLGFPVLHTAQPATGAWNVTAFNAAEWGVLDVA